MLFPGKYRALFPDDEVSVVLVVIVQPPRLDSRIDLEEGTVPKGLKCEVCIKIGGGGSTHVQKLCRKLSCAK